MRIVQNEENFQGIGKSLLLQPFIKYVIILTAVIVEEHLSLLPTNRILSYINVGSETVDRLR
jgi:hypothetical protein